MEVFVGLLFCLVVALLIWLVALQSNFDSFKSETEKILRSLSKQDIKKGISIEELKQEQDLQKAFDNSYEIEPKKAIPLEKSFINKYSSDSQNEFKKPEVGFEKYFMENIFNKIGAVALVIGLGIFIKLISPFFVLTPPMQISIGLLAGLAMVFGSIKLHKDEMKNYAEVLMGTGFAVLFIAIYCGCSLFHIIPTPVAVGLASMIVIATYFMAQKYKSFSTIAIGLLGGYMNPFFINSDVSTTFLFAYLIFVNLISIVYVQRNQDKIALNYVNLILTTLTVSIFASGNDPIKLVFPLVLWGAYVVNELINAKNDYNEESKRLSWLNFAALVWFANYIFHFQDKIYIGLTILISGLVYGLCAYFVRKFNDEFSKNYFYGLLLSILVATYFLADGSMRTYMWAIEALAVAFAAQKSKEETFERWSFTFLLTSFTSIFLQQNALVVSDLQNYSPIWNERTLIFGVPILSGLISSKMIKEQNENMAECLNFVGISFIYLFVIFEFNAILSKIAYVRADFSEIANFVKWISYSIVGLVYSVNMKRLSYSSSAQYFNFAGSGIFVIALIVMLFCGWTYSPLSTFIPILNIRFVAFAAAIAASLLFAKWEKEDMFEYVAIIIGALLLNCETKDFLALKVIDQNIILSIMWILYSGIIMITGTFKKIKSMKLSGIWITILAIVKIIFFDLANVDAVYKIAAFLCLGIVLMLVSYFYTKNKE